MEILPIKKWGNSNGVRIPKHIMQFLEVETNDSIIVEMEQVYGKKRLIIESEKSKETDALTIEELFADYDGGAFQTKLQDLGEARGNEKW